MLVREVEGDFSRESSLIRISSGKTDGVLMRSYALFLAHTI